MFFELNLKGKENCLLFTVLGELSLEHCSKETCGAPSNLPPPPPTPTHTGNGKTKFFQVLPRALDTAASLPCWKNDLGH